MAMLTVHFLLTKNISSLWALPRLLLPVIPTIPFYPTHSGYLKQRNTLSHTHTHPVQTHIHTYTRIFFDCAVAVNKNSKRSLNVT